MATRDGRRSFAPPPGMIAGLRRGAVLALLTVVAFMGGVSATQLWPVHTQTQYFAADVSVSPSLSSTVNLPMVVGDVIMSFDGPLPAPGLDAQVSVREEVTDLLRSGRLSTASLEPSQQELRAAIDSGVQEVAWKFALGALVTSLLVFLTYTVARPHHLGRVVAAATVATLVATLGPGTAAYLTYRTEKVAQFRATSLLSLVQTNRSILTELTSNADHGAVYVTNLLALSDALRQEFTPGTTQAPSAAKFLLVSDIHGMNQYPLMRQIVASEGIDAVIDAGDLLNFGQAREGVLTGIYDGIESLGVPYIFVRGNHDGASRDDEAVLDRLSRIPNVVLLEPTAGDYVEVGVNGVTISGFNDPRYYNERSDDFGAEQVAAAQAFEKATAGLTPTDLVVTHEPYAADRVTATGVTLNGHMHVAALQRGHVQMGSFTGGGLVNQFRLPPLTEEAQQAAQEDPETAGELQGHPYSFDILSMGQDCSIVSLIRYSYRNLVSGRPQYDDIRMINGRTLQPDPPADRTCGPDLGVVTSTMVAAPDLDQASTTAEETTTLTIPPPSRTPTHTPSGGQDDVAVTSGPPRR
ncbi:metallophosphoesterase family protein [Ornithinimicrobium avium]|uniref:Metallophosphoesterase n=1 Tax=Ornithinimicrobium avium TaxID=2283195 RepID=A0A345NN74_9MICO|nr:metallophosphoesterase [Ornithinimicrobium avium]AXH96482.1 metallophosphoesterase [Ornithinimicrobium avium]